MKRAALFLLFLLVAAATVGVAAPTASPPSAPIAAGVTVDGVPVAGLTSEPARARLRASAAQELRFRFGQRRWQATPGELGASFAVDQAVARALAAEPGASVDLDVRVPQVAVRRYVAELAQRFALEPRSSRLVGLVGFRPFITRARPGRAVRRRAMERAIARALEESSREPIALAVRDIRPKLTRADFGPMIVISRWTNALQLFRGMRPWRTFRVATGSPQYPTPSGSFRIVVKERDPWWRPPPSDWAKGLEPVPPGPGNPLGTRWMGLSAGLVGIHGTPNAASIGYSASHGCIRMHIDEAAWLFEQVSIGTPVFIV